MENSSEKSMLHLAVFCLCCWRRVYKDKIFLGISGLILTCTHKNTGKMKRKISHI